MENNNENNVETVIKKILEKYRINEILVYSLDRSKLYFSSDQPMIPSFKLINYVNKLLLNFPLHNPNKDIKGCGDCCGFSFCFSTMKNDNCFFIFTPSNKKIIRELKEEISATLC